MAASEMFNKRLLMFTGKGGVGKSTIAAGLAVLAAQMSKRVLIVEIDTKSAMKQIFDVPYLGFEPIEISDNIWAINIDPKEALEEYIQEHARIHKLAQLITGNKILRYFFKTAPAVNELVTINAIYRLEQEKSAIGPRFDIIIIDMPASGHALLFLQIPQMVKRLTRRGPLFKMVDKYDKLLRDPAKTMLNIVTLPEEMPVTETIELLGKLKDGNDLPLGYLFINCVPERIFDDNEAGLLRSMKISADDNGNEAVSELLFTGMDNLNRQSRFSIQMKRLSDFVELEKINAPRLPLSRFNLAGARHLAEKLKLELGMERV